MALYLGSKKVCPTKKVQHPDWDKYTTVTSNLSSIVGTLTQSTYGSIGGFASGKYAIALSNISGIGSNPWSLQFEFTTGSDVTSYQEIISMAKRGCTPAYMHDNVIAWFASSNGSSWDICGGHNYMSGIQPYTTYRMKMEFTGTAYNIYQYVNDSWVLKDSVTSSTKIYQTGELFMSVNRRGSNNGSQPFLGTINLKECNLTVNGAVTWRGAV